MYVAILLRSGVASYNVYLSPKFECKCFEKPSHWHHSFVLRKWKTIGTASYLKCHFFFLLEIRLTPNKHTNTNAYIYIYTLCNLFTGIPSVFKTGLAYKLSLYDAFIVHKCQNNIVLLRHVRHIIRSNSFHSNWISCQRNIQRWNAFKLIKTPQNVNIHFPKLFPKMNENIILFARHY